jgi:hypothetical protein
MPILLTYYGLIETVAEDPMITPFSNNLLEGLRVSASFKRDIDTNQERDAAVIP